jgi:hypothetical protein
MTLVFDLVFWLQMIAMRWIEGNKNKRINDRRNGGKIVKWSE